MRKSGRKGEEGKEREGGWEGERGDHIVAEK